MWEHVGLYAFSCFVASLGGLWHYFDSTERAKRRGKEALISMLGSGLLGLSISFVACYYLCANESALPLVAAISGMSGLLGVTPQYALEIFRRIRLNEELKDEREAHRLRPPPDSDTTSPFV